MICHPLRNVTKVSEAQSFRLLSLHCTHPRPQASMSAPSLTHFITKRPWLKRWMTPLAHWYADAAGYRKLGLRYFLNIHRANPPFAPNLFSSCCLVIDIPFFLFFYKKKKAFRVTNRRIFVPKIERADDLIPEESNTVMLALKRLPPKEAYDRVFRLRRAFQVCLNFFSIMDWQRRYHGHHACHLDQLPHLKNTSPTLSPPQINKNKFC